MNRYILPVVAGFLAAPVVLAAAIGADRGSLTGIAGGDLAGTYPNPTVTQCRGLLDTSGPTLFPVGAIGGDAPLAVIGGQIVGDGTITRLFFGSTTAALDFNPDAANAVSDDFITVTESISSNTTFTTTNLAAGVTMNVLITNSAASHTLTFPVGWVFFGTAPTTLAASKHARLELISTTSANSGVRATYFVEP